jgi:thiamine biosynthesis protein ThiS
LTIIVNGEKTDIAEGSAISDLVETLGLTPNRLAVELNRRIIRRADWGSTTISEGDKVEIVHFVGGGSDSRIVTVDPDLQSTNAHRGKSCQIR